MLRRVAAVATIAAVVLTLAACGGSEDAGSDASDVQTASNGDVFNDADVEFATGMIPHHAQAIQMTVLAQGNPLDPEVNRLVEQIRQAQDPEIETMTDWLTAWGIEVPETPMDDSNAGHDMDDMDDMGSGSDMGDMPGMMSQDQMDQLESASDAEFQDMWLQMMIEHHEGAVEKAQQEQEDGEFPAAIELAESIEKGQTEEIQTMQELLD